MSDPDACPCCGELARPTLPDGEWACGCEWEGCDKNCPVVGYLYSAALDAEEHDHTEDIRHGIFAELPNRTSLRRRMMQWRDRAEAAEAEADRLRKALEEIAYERRLYEDNEHWFVPKEDKDFLRPARAEQSRQQYRARKALDAEDGDE